MRTNIKKIAEFYEKYPECIGNIRVDTRHGLKDIEYADITAYDSEVITITTDNELTASSSPEHRFFIADDWKKTKDIVIGDKILTKDGYHEITSIVKEPQKEDLYDLQVSDVQEFYANNLVSHNSTMIDALSFSLFGKAHRNIKKDQLVNSVNNRKLEVEVTFTIGKNHFKVRRGIKPTIFEIYKNNKKINQDSDSRDYQKLLEQTILKLNYKSFHQIVVIGSTSFTSFMDLPAAQRRQIIEELLDINVFGVMSNIAKDQTQKLKDNIKYLENQIEIHDVKIESENKLILNVENMNETIIQERQKNLSDLEKQQDAIENKAKDIENKAKDKKYVQAFQDRDDLLKKKEDHETTKSNLNYSLQQNKEKHEFFVGNESCPTCYQDISQDLKTTMTKEILTEAKTSVNAIKDIDEYLKAVTEDITNNNLLLEKHAALVEEHKKHNIALTAIKKDIKAHKKLIKDYEKRNQQDVNKHVEEHKKLIKALDDLKSELLDNKNQVEYNTAISEMLKDSGIKTKIIRQYTPLINHSIREYLEILDFYVAFHLDEQFNETIKSRHLDNFNYSSFSEGEKQRIDLALLFTWRKVANMKNSISTNLLILDETFDSSMDESGIESLINILDTLDNKTNVFIISHKTDMLEDKFRSKIEFVKKGNFSYLQ